MNFLIFLSPTVSSKTNTLETSFATAGFLSISPFASSESNTAIVSLTTDFSPAIFKVPGLNLKSTLLVLIVKILLLSKLS